MELFKKRKKNPVNVKKNSTNQPLNKLVNGELPFGWYHYNKDFFADFDKTIPTLAIATQTGTDQERIEALEKLIAYYEDFKRICYSESECHKKYFQNMWEHCNNSKMQDFEYITPYREELASIKQR